MARDLQAPRRGVSGSATTDWIDPGDKGIDLGKEYE